MKKFKIILYILLIILLIPLVINFYVIFRYNFNIKTVDEIDKTYDYGLVLGCSVLKNGEPSKMLKDRLDTAIELYNKHLIMTVIISGDHKEGYSEVEVMAKYLEENGLNEGDFLIDYEGYSTKDSLKNYRDNYEDATVIVITQKYHLYRALNLMDKLNIVGTGVKAVEKNYAGQMFREIREILARNKDFIIPID